VVYGSREYVDNRNMCIFCRRVWAGRY